MERQRQASAEPNAGRLKGSVPTATAGYRGGSSLRLHTAYARYENASHPNYGAAEYSADLAQCRNRSVTMVVSTQAYNVQSGAGVDEMKTNACMAIQ